MVDKKITIVFQQSGDRDVVETRLSHPLDSLQIVDGFMWSLVSLLRTNGYQDEEIPDVVRESLREAMLGDSTKLGGGRGETP